MKKLDIISNCDLSGRVVLVNHEPEASGILNFRKGWQGRKV